MLLSLHLCLTLTGRGGAAFGWRPATTPARSHPLTAERDGRPKLLVGGFPVNQVEPCVHYRYADEDLVMVEEGGIGGMQEEGGFC